MRKVSHVLELNDGLLWIDNRLYDSSMNYLQSLEPMQVYITPSLDPFRVVFMGTRKGSSTRGNSNPTVIRGQRLRYKPLRRYGTDWFFLRSMLVRINNGNLQVDSHTLSSDYFNYCLPEVVVNNDADNGQSVVHTPYYNLRFTTRGASPYEYAAGPVSDAGVAYTADFTTVIGPTGPVSSGYKNYPTGRDYFVHVKEIDSDRVVYVRSPANSSVEVGVLSKTNTFSGPNVSNTQTVGNSTAIVANSFVEGNTLYVDVIRWPDSVANLGAISGSGAHGFYRLTYTMSASGLAYVGTVDMTSALLASSPVTTALFVDNRLHIGTSTGLYRMYELVGKDWTLVHEDQAYAEPILSIGETSAGTVLALSCWSNLACFKPKSKMAGTVAVSADGTSVSVTLTRNGAAASGKVRLFVRGGRFDTGAFKLVDVAAGVATVPVSASGGVLTVSMEVVS